MLTGNDLAVNQELLTKIKSEFEKGGSDKVNHSYERVYQYYFSKIEPKALLEIGLANYAPTLGTHGANSLFIWPRLFPDCDVYGGDLQDDRLFNSTRPDHPGPTIPPDLDASKLHAYQVDQESEASLSELSKKIGDIQFDIIIDDASHVFANSKRTFETFFPKLGPKGFYFIEDNARVVRGTQQNIGDWDRYLRLQSLTLDYKIIDARSGDPNDQDSVMVVAWKI